MAILKVAQLGNPVLRKKAAPIPPEAVGSPEVQKLIDDMVETKDEYLGAGLAAPQVHESVQLAILGGGQTSRYPDSDELPLIVLVNPKITSFSDEMDEDWEGCLSVGDLWGRVKRSVAITVQALDRKGAEVEYKPEGFMARVFQHEIDHLHGKVFLDRMSDFSSLCFKKEFGKYHALYERGED